MTAKVKQGRPVDPTKRKAIIKSAAKLFMKYGYGKVSLDKIATSAKVTKQTIYRYFKNKDDLFIKIIEDKCIEHSPSTEILEDVSLHPKELLEILGIKFLDLLFSKECLDMYRLVMCESINPKSKVPAMFYKYGPQAMTDMLVKYLSLKRVNKFIKVDNPVKAAKLYFSLLQDLDYMEAKLSTSYKYTLDQKKAKVNEALAVFLAYYPLTED